MREIVLDTETTGLDPDAGHRLVEIGCVELHNHVPTGVTFHRYINPERDMPEEALAVHGLSSDFLRQQPVFAQHVDDFLAFIGDARLIIHNAEFDMKFLNAELARLGRPVLSMQRVVDTLTLARKRFPGAAASLDALCKRFGIDTSARSLHGALLDSQLLAEVYLELMGGRQADLSLGVSRETAQPEATPRPRSTRPAPLPPRLTEAEARAHEAFVAAMGDGAIWHRRR